MASSSAARTTTTTGWCTIFESPHSIDGCVKFRGSGFNPRCLPLVLGGLCFGFRLQLSSGGEFCFKFFLRKYKIFRKMPLKIDNILTYLCWDLRLPLPILVALLVWEWGRGRWRRWSSTAHVAYNHVLPLVKHPRLLMFQICPQYLYFDNLLSARKSTSRDCIRTACR